MNEGKKDEKWNDEKDKDVGRSARGRSESGFHTHTHTHAHFTGTILRLLFIQQQNFEKILKVVFQNAVSQCDNNVHNFHSVLTMVLLHWTQECKINRRKKKRPNE